MYEPANAASTCAPMTLLACPPGEVFASASARNVHQLVNAAEDKRSYSSVVKDDAIGTGNAQSALDSAASWWAKTSNTHQWTRMDLGIVFTVTGVVTRGSAGNK